VFVDVTRHLASPASRANLLEALGKSDPLIRDALQTILRPRRLRPVGPGRGARLVPPGGAPATPIETDPAIPADLIARSQTSIAALKRDIEAKSGSALLDFILEDIQELRRTAFDPRGLQVIVAAMEATWWLNEQLQAWLGEKNAADSLTQSVPHNVTSEMGLALLEVADVIRPHPEVVAFLRQVDDDDFLDALPELAGGREARDAIQAYLDEYGMRCSGEIDITRPRWSERPPRSCPRSSVISKTSSRARASGASSKGGRRPRKGAEVLAPLAGVAGRRAEGRRGQADDRPCPDLHGVSGISEVRNGQPLLRLQAGLVEAAGSPRLGTYTKHPSTSVRGDPGSPRTNQV